ncbi:MAG TPA: hypothetical protein PKA59_12475 [Chakrabartia sp.]|jgi:hypothetical protein|nr:hypothetical protein [Chakrabartia sp.]
MLPPDADAAYVEALIRQEYKDGGHHLGWSYFGSPMSRLRSAPVATLGLNPGGGREGPCEWDQYQAFDFSEGNAYFSEKWGKGGGDYSPLQVQIHTMVQSVLGLEGSDLLSFNLVPFRSPTWVELPDAQRALEFGLSLLSWATASPNLKLIIAFGVSVAEARIVDTLGATAVEKDHSMETGWGRTRARIYSNGRLNIVFIPHLSRYRIFGRSGALRLEARLRAMVGS